MPVAMTFTSLQDDIKTYMERGGALDSTVEAQLPSLINLAERNIAAAIKVQGFLEVVTTTFAAGTSVYLKPTRWRETVSMFYGSGQARNPLYPREYGYCRFYWPDSSVQSPPLFYANYDYTHWLIAPTPDAAYNVEVVYYQLPPLLDATNTTNWLTEYAPNVLLYRTLYETAIFIKDLERAGAYQSLYTDALGIISTEDLRNIVDRSTTRQES